MTAVEAPARRRHTLGDLYHERTDFQFIAHSKRWVILSGVLLLVSVAALGIRQLNLGIDFEGGTAWQVEVGDKDARVEDVRDVLRPFGLADSKVSILSGTSGDTIRVQAEIPENPIVAGSEAVAGLAEVDDAQVQFERRGEGGTFTATVAEGADAAAGDYEDALRDLRIEGPDATLDGRNLTVEVTGLPESQTEEISAALAEYAGAELDEVSVSKVGPTWGNQVTRKALQAMLIFFVLLAVYLSLRFEWKMAAAAITAVFHDIVVTVGFYAVFQFEVTPATVTAFLTILGFSLYDTVVVFDKVRENQVTLLATGRTTYGEMVNRSLNQVLMRSLSTTLVALLPVVSLLVVGSLIMGAVALEHFGLALFAGLLVGSYSSIYVAAPLLVWWKEREPQLRALRERRVARAEARAVGRVATEVPERVAEPAAATTAVRPAPRGPVTPRARQPRRRKRK